MKRVFNIFKRKSKWFFLFLAMLGAINSVWNMNLLFIINDTISGVNRFKEYGWIIFILLLIVSIITSRLFNGYMVKLTKNLIYEQGIVIIEKIRFASYENFMKLGTEKIYTARMDIEAISGLPQTIISAFNSAVVVLCCLVYLFYLSVTATIVLLIFIVAIALFYFVQNSKLEKKLNKVRDLENSYFAYLKDLLYGFKEIKMSTVRNDNLFNKHIKKNREDEKKLGIDVSIAYLNNSFVGVYGWYLVIGLIVFVIPKIGNFNFSATATYTVAILYLMGHINSLMDLFPVYTRIKIAFERLDEFDENLNSLLVMERKGHSDEEFKDSFHTIEFKEVTFSYYDKKRKSSFSLGPLNLKVEAGDLIFVTGGNGSGKSTFTSLFTGLCKPTTGKIYFNGEELNDTNYTQYRNKISAVFTNNYIFSTNYENYELSGNIKFKDAIELMGLDWVIPDGSYDSIVPEYLSKGQHKRLSVVNAIMEERDIMILDECAAELDPQFKEFFYTKLLDLFKSMGKTVVVITHDDKYFDKADRFIKMEEGKIIIDKKSVYYEN
jgi:cyclic peptide transporter